MRRVSVSQLCESVGVNRWKDEDSMGGREEGIYSMLEIAITRIGEFTLSQKYVAVS